MGAFITESSAVGPPGGKGRSPSGEQKTDRGASGICPQRLGTCSSSSPVLDTLILPPQDSLP